MNKIIFPALLAATIMVAGAFAFMPVEQASTVHTSGVAVTATATSTTNDTEDEDITVTCDATTACIIYDVIITENEAAALDLGALAVNLDGNAIADYANADLGTILNDSTYSINASDFGSAFGLGEDDTITIVVEDGSSASTDYTVTVIASGSVSITFA